MLKTLQALAVASAALAFVPGVCVADSDVIAQPVAYPIDQEVPAKGCDEAIRDAQFLRELQRTDGDVNPEMPAVPECEQETRSA